MKKVILACLSLLLALYLPAQVVSDLGNDNDLNVSQLGSIGPGTASARGFDKRYEGAKGSPFLFEGEWPKGDVFFIDGKSIEDKLRVNIDLVENEAYVQLENGEMMILFKEPIQKVIIRANETEYLFECGPTLEADKQKDRKKFYQVIHRGNYELLKLPRKFFEKANFSGAYSPDIRHDSFSRMDEYFLKAPQNDHVKVKLKRASLKKALPQKKKTIINFLNRKKMYTIDEAALLSLMDYLDVGND